MTSDPSVHQCQGLKDTMPWERSREISKQQKQEHKFCRRFITPIDVYKTKHDPHILENYHPIDVFIGEKLKLNISVIEFLTIMVHCLECYDVDFFKN